MRFRLAVAYVGSAFRGWSCRLGARQRKDVAYAAAASVPCGVEDVLNGLLLEQEARGHWHVPSLVQGSSRTDAGVHALYNVCHVDVVPQVKAGQTARHEISAAVVQRALAHTLHTSAQWSRYADALHILDARPVEPEFHARFSAIARSYLFRIAYMRTWNDCKELPLWERDRAWLVHATDRGREFDLEAVQHAVQSVLGNHDFSAFRNASCQSTSAWRCVTYASVERDVPPRCAWQHTPQDRSARAGAEVDMFTVRIRGSSFVYRMVRNLVGALVEVGRGRMSVSEFREMLAEAEARSTSKYLCAPAHGLFLSRVFYPDDTDELDASELELLCRLKEAIRMGTHDPATFHV